MHARVVRALSVWFLYLSTFFWKFIRVFMSASLRFSDGVRELFVTMRRNAAFVCFKLRFMCMFMWSKFQLDPQVRFCSVAFSEKKKSVLQLYERCCLDCLVAAVFIFSVFFMVTFDRLATE